MKIKDTNVCLRLGEERKRLNLNQNKVASYCEVSIKTIGRWERNTPIPSNKLALLVQLGYDITYILTGVNLSPQTEGLEAAASVWNTSTNSETAQQSSAVINKEQERWLNLLENLAGGNQKRLQEIGLALVGYSRAITDKQSS